MNTYFVAIDFEHATGFKGSVCSVGIVSYNENGDIIDEYSTLIQPPKNEYNFYNTRVHGISKEATKNAPKFPEVYPEIKKRINGNIVVAHNAFGTDKLCLEQAMEHHKINETLNIDWQCTYKITNAKLNEVAETCNIELNHHDSLSDARACAKIYYLHKQGLLPQKFKSQNKSKGNKTTKTQKKNYTDRLKGDVFKPDFDNAANKTNPFFMKKVVITGFPNAIKEEIANNLKKLGSDIDSTVTKKTNYLIIGENAGPSKLSKMRKNIDENRDARIINFNEYNELINLI
jgi:DNA polymerase-3 subunit epsilon